MTHLARLAATLPLLLIALACNHTAPPAGPMASKSGAVDYTPRAASGILGHIERLDPAIDALIPKDAEVEILCKGMQWAEGPVFIRGQALGSTGLLFSDVPQNTVYRLDPESRAVSVFLRPSGYSVGEPRGGETGSNGLTLDGQGRLTLCQHGDRRIARLNPDNRSFTSLIDRQEGKRFNSPNDLCFDKAGNLFFTDPPYGLEKNMEDPKKELAYQGVYRLTKEGQLTLLTKELTRPNGIALSPDEKILYVAVSDSAKPFLWAFDLAADGTISNGRVFFDMTKFAADKDNKGLPDGMKIDRNGNVFCTGPGGLFIISPAGKHLGTLRTGEKTANCAWGDDGSTLYITADTYIARLRTSTKGAGW